MAGLKLRQMFYLKAHVVVPYKRAEQICQTTRINLSFKHFFNRMESLNDI